MPAAQFESGKGTRYFAGLDARNSPIWSEKESDATAIVTNATMGDLSVTWCKGLGLWLMTYDSREPAPRGILFSYSRTPWRPWSEPQIIFNAVRDGAVGKFIHNPQGKPRRWTCRTGDRKRSGESAGRSGWRLCAVCRRAINECARLRTQHLLRAVNLESLRCRIDEITVARRVTLAMEPLLQLSIIASGDGSKAVASECLR